jgi:hypothetical protein
VLTRLHARYGKDSLGEDLVFRAAPPIMGGREVHGAEGKIERGAQPGGVNNFQGRYIIRHAWTGPIECENPRRGIWGGPPGGGEPPIEAAQDLAFVPRDAPLASYVRQDIEEIDFKRSEADANAKFKTSGIPQKGGGCAGCVTGRGSAGVVGGALLLIAALGLLAARRGR